MAWRYNARNLRASALGLILVTITAAIAAAEGGRGSSGTTRVPMVSGSAHEAPAVVGERAGEAAAPVTVAAATPGGALPATSPGATRSPTALPNAGPPTTFSSHLGKFSRWGQGLWQDLPVPRTPLVPGVIETLAGNGTFGFSGDGGPATEAALAGDSGLTRDAAGNLYIADLGNYRVRKLAPDGRITTVAGTGIPGFSGDGDGGPATQAQVSPAGLAVGADGALYISDIHSNRVRRVDSQGLISTFAGGASWPYLGDGGPATSAGLAAPFGLAFDHAGNLYIADSGHQRIRRVDGTGTITTVAGSNDVYGFGGDGGPATLARLSYPTAVAVGLDGSLYIADLENARVRKVIAPLGIIVTVAGTGDYDFYGDGGPATKAALHGPMGVALDAMGNLYIADGNRIQRVNVAGLMETVAGNPNGLNWGFAGDGGQATAALLYDERGILSDPLGTLWISDNCRVREIYKDSLAPPLIGPPAFGIQNPCGS
jgi:sugar lactone lactonase YvrE